MSVDIVFLSTADWENPFWTNKQHVAKELAKIGYRVLYIDSLGLRRPTTSRSDVNRIVRRLLKAFRPPRKVVHNLWVWSPVILPLHGNHVFRRINRMFLAAGLGVCLKLLGFKRHWFWTYNPITCGLFTLSRFRCKIYHCVDEIKAQPGMPAGLLEAEEKRLAKKVDIIFTTSPKLTETRGRWNRNTYYLPNVADFNHFATARLDETEIPLDLRSIPGLKVGFIGAISSYKVDFQLLRKIAESRPEWALVLIGEVGEGDPWTESELLKEVDNLHLLGPRNYDVLPAYLKGFDVALLPNRVNEYTESMFPMKFFEYLASGVPVVSVGLKALQEFQDVVTIAHTAEEFVEAIEGTLKGNAPSLEKRLKTALQYTYEKRTRKMLSIIRDICMESTNVN